MSRLAFLLLLLLATGSTAFAQETSPALCLGYNPETKTWGQAGVSPYSFSEPTECPENYAMVGVRRPLGSYRSPKFTPIMGDCCPLPVGVLLPEKFLHSEQCPENSIVTGARFNPPFESCVGKDPGCMERWQKVETELICTKIDSTRYALAEVRAGIRWGMGYNFSEMTRPQLLRQTLPAGLREGIGRFSRIGWRLEGCVGDPPGSFLVGRSGKRCHEFQFRTLLDSETKQPVKTFPDCRRVADPLDPQTLCLE